MTTTITPRATKVKSNKKNKPAQLRSCVCVSRPAYRCTLAPEGLPGEVEINGGTYELHCLGHDSRGGYRLVKLTPDPDADPTVYDIDTESGYPVCDCPDFVFRRGDNMPEAPYCKHSLALIELRRKGVI